MFYESNESMSHESMSQWVRSEKIKVSVETIKLSITLIYLIFLLASLLPAHARPISDMRFHVRNRPCAGSNEGSRQKLSQSNA